MNNEINYVSPFKKFVITIGNLPTAYLESMSYYEAITFLVNYLSNNVIPALNNNGLVVEELQAKFTELKNYVDHYFDNLDLQEEVNNKLDAMVLDGTLDEIINQTIFGDLNNQVTQNKNDIITLNGDISTINGSITSINNDIKSLEDEKIKEIRKRYYENYHVFEYPESISSYFDKLTIYESYDKKNYKYAIDIDSLKVSGGTTYYVDATNGADTNNGTSEGTAWKTLTKALLTVSDNDTIIVKKDIYSRAFLDTNYNKLHDNINIICEKGTILGLFDLLTYSQNGTYPNVYEANRTNVNHCIDIRGKDEGVFAQLQYVNSLSLCSSTLNSYYTDSSKVYVNIGEAVTNDKVLCTLNINSNGILIDCPTEGRALKLYLENAICLSGTKPWINATSSSSYRAEFIGVNCKFMFKKQSDNIYDGVELRGSDSVLIDCEASFNGKDGFNYHAINGQTCNGIEINCKASFNGLNSGDNLSNGSTIHDGSQIVRINGVYNNNHGSNVADVNNNSISYNINCLAFDSMSSGDDYTDSDFNAQQSGAHMYLYNCFAKGNSKYNLYCISGADMYVSNTEYDTSDGTITPIV